MNPGQHRLGQFGDCRGRIQAIRTPAALSGHTIEDIALTYQHSLPFPTTPLQPFEIIADNVLVSPGVGSWKSSTTHATLFRRILFLP